MTGKKRITGISHRAYRCNFKVRWMVVCGDTEFEKRYLRIPYGVSLYLRKLLFKDNQGLYTAT